MVGRERAVPKVGSALGINLDTGDEKIECPALRYAESPCN